MEEDPPDPVAALPEGAVPHADDAEHAVLPEEVERTALILVGPALAQEGFEESRLYAGDYDRRYRPVGTHPRFPGTGG